jgi:Putative Actinobacterial Holin-X, holin superfamily III
MSHSENSFARPDLKDQAPADLIRSVSELVPRLVKDELALGRLELQEKGKRAGAGAGLLGAAGLVGWFGLAVLIAAAVLGLAEAVPAWLSAVIVAVVLALSAGVLALIGRSQLKKAVPPAPERAIASTREDVRVVKESARP